MEPFNASKMSKFESHLENLTKPGPDRVIPGCVAMVVNKDGIIYEKAFGTESVDPESPLYNQPFSRDSFGWFASCTKLMTAISVMQCVEKGLLDLDADISTILPEFKDAQIIKGLEEGSGKPILELAKNKITLKLLLSHSSGLCYTPLDPQLLAWKKYIGKPHKEDGTFHDICFVPLKFEPGTGWTYGYGTDWAGEMVARVSGLKLGEYMQQNIWAPLGMKSTTFHLEERPDLLKIRTDMSMRTSDGKIIPSQIRAWPDKLGDDHGGGGSYSCAADYTKVLIALLRNDGTLLKSESIHELFKPCLSESSKAALDQMMFVPYPGNEKGQVNFMITGGLPQAGDLDYGIGGMVNKADISSSEDTGLRRKENALTWSGFPNLHWVLDRESGLGVFYASQIIPPGDEPTTKIMSMFEEAVHSKDIPLGKL